MRRFLPPVPDDLLSQRASLHRRRVGATRRPLPAGRQRLLVDRQPRGAASGGGSPDRRGDSQAPGLLDPSPGSEVLRAGPSRGTAAARVLLESGGVLPQFRLSAPLSDPPDLRALV